MTNNAHEKKKKRREMWTVALVSGAHFFSHFYVLAIPSALPLIREDFGVSNLTVGMIIMGYAISSAIWQYPMGVFSDRFGASPFLVSGLVVVSLGIFAMGLAPSITLMVVIAALNGTADAVFHPADYTIITAKVRPNWLGRCYAIHTTSGFLGFAMAPIAMSFLISNGDWRTAFSIIGMAGLAFAAILFLTRGLLRGIAYEPAQNAAGGPTGALKFLTSPAMILMFLFYVAATLSQNGIQSFGNAALIEIFDIDLILANGALAAYMWGITIGVLSGGIVADRMGRFDLIASGGYLVAGALLCLIAFGALSFASVVATLFFSGFMVGAVMPARDIMVKSITPAGATGKAFGFVSSGFGVAGTIGPALYATLMDMGLPQGIFLGAAVMMLVTIGFALAATAVGRRMAGAQAA